MPAAPFIPQIAEWLAVTDANNWPDRAGSGMTVSVDNSVQFQGHATLRIDIPANSSGTYRVGTTGATVNLPASIDRWDGQRWLYCAMRSSNLAAVDNYNIFFGDAGFANFYTSSFDAGNYPELLYRNNDWMITPSPTAFGVGGGSPTFTGAKRLRINFTVISDASPTTIWIGAVGFLPFQKAKVMIQLDDGYDEHYTFAAAEARTYKVPISLSIASGFTNTVGYMTRAQLVELAADPYVCLTNHGVDNSGYNALGLQPYVNQVLTCADFLASVGAPQGRSHHVYVRSQWDNALSDALQARGFKTARSGISTGTRNWQDMTPAWSGERRLMAYTCAEDLEVGTTLANVQTQVLNAIAARQTCVIVGHRLEATIGVDQWPTTDFTALLAWLSGLQNQGLIDCMRADDWYVTQTQALDL